MKDCFEDIHVLLKNKMYIDVINLVFDKKLNRINKPYDFDLNHAWYIVGDIFFKTQKYNSAISCFKKALIFVSFPSSCLGMPSLKLCLTNICPLSKLTLWDVVATKF